MLLFLEGFETYGASPGAPVGLSTTWTLSGTHTTTDLVAGRCGGLALRIANGVAVADMRIDVGSHAALIAGFAYRPGEVPNNDGRVVSFREGNTEHVTLRMQGSGEVSIYRGTTLLATSSGVVGVAGNAWCFIEVKATIDNSAGAYEVRVNGVNVLSATGVDTRNGGATGLIDNVRLYGNNSSDSANRASFDDLYIGDLAAGFVGSHKVVTSFPNASGDSTDWSPSAGNNYAAVDEAGHDGDSTYVQSAVSGDRDLYNFADVTLTDILGVQADVIVRETDATPFPIKIVCKSGSTTDDGSSIPIGSTTFVTRTRTFPTDPDSGVAWGNSALNAAQFGIEVA